MAGSIPNVEEQRIGENYVSNGVSIRLYSNNYTPVEASTLANFTEVSGGGYSAVSLAGNSFTWTPGDPTVGEAPEQEWVFTGATTAPGTIYGYYLVDLVTGLYIGGERFAGAILPFTPVAGSTIRLTPTVQVS